MLSCAHNINAQLYFANAKASNEYAAEKEKIMDNNVFEGIDEVFEGIKERLELLPELHRDVIEMSFGLDGGSPMNIKDIAWQLGEEYIHLTPVVVKLIQKEGLRMLRFAKKTDEWQPGTEAKDFDPSGFAYLTWKQIDHICVSTDKIAETKEYLRKHFAGSDYVTIPTLKELYEYEGDDFGYLDDVVKPNAEEYRFLQNKLYNVVNLLEGMGKTLLPDRKIHGNSAAPLIFDYSYLDIETAERIVLFNTSFTEVPSPVRTIKGMFDETDYNGVLVFPGWYEPTEEDEADCEFRCIMNWDEKDLDELLQDFSDFYLKLLELGEVTGTDFDPNKLDKELGSLYETLFLYKQCGNTYFEGDSPAIDIIIRRAIRFIKLVQIGVPLIVQWGEASYIAQAYAIYKCGDGKSLEKIPKQAV